MLLEERRKQGRGGFRQENTEGEEIRTDRNVNSTEKVKVFFLF